MKKSLLFVLIFVFSALMTSVQASEIVGTVRVSFLSETLVRLEEKGPQGYCDEQTFHIPDRASFSEVSAVRTEENGYVLLSTTSYTVYVPMNATTLNNIYITQNGSRVWAYASVINNQAQLPAPGETCYAYSIADNPRIIVPSHGYAYNPAAGANNGWNLNNDARDVYVFLPKNDPVQLRKDFVQLTGRTEMIPLWALGAWDSRYYPYSDIDSYNRVDAYRNNGLPLDVFVVDTDWRQPSGGVVGTGYTINTAYFPDITGFTNHMHNNKHVRLVFNDHPEPTDSNTLSAAETKFRTENLQRILGYGVDAWWYDRNWHVTINSPSSAIPNHAFGMYAYHSITQNFAPNRRPMLLSNIVGVGGGYKEFASNISSHRFSVQWTGDIWADDQSLWREIEHVAREGAISALPYVSADIGGHLKNPSTDGYIRWVQFYEDDTESVAYKSGAFRTTDIESTYENGVHTLTVHPAIGTFSGADKFSTRTFTFRIHAPENWGSMTYARINGQPVGAAEYVRDGSASPFAFSGGARDGRMIEITYTASLLDKIELQYAFLQESNIAFDGFGSFKVFDASVSTPDASINLTVLGVVDYLHVNPQSVGNVVRKANRANSVLGAFSAGSGAGVFHDGRTTFTWNDGTLTAQTSGTTSGFTNATGFTLRLNASTAPRIVTLFLGGWQSKSLLKIADDSGNVIKTFSFENLTGTYDKAVTFTVQATNADTPVYLYYTMVKTSATGGNISFTAAAVTEAADNATVEKISSVVSPTSLNLTKQGYSDWAVFGTGIAADVQKKSCPREASIHKLSYGKTPLQFVDNRVLISWEDGALMKENIGTRNGPVIDSSSFSTAVKATSTPKYITFYVGGWKSNARFTVTDADGDTLYAEDFGDASTNYYRTIKLKVQAPADEWLYVTYTHTNPGNGNITFSAITVAPEFYSLRDKNGHFEIYNNADTKVVDAIVADYDTDGRLIYADLVPLTVTDMEKIGENTSLSENARLYMLDSLESLNPVQ